VSPFFFYLELLCSPVVDTVSKDLKWRKRMRLLDLRSETAELITNFDSTGVFSVKGAMGSGTGHVYNLYFQPGGQIGRHPAGPAQLFLVVDGTGWVEGEDGIKEEIRSGEAAYFAPGETHAKGSNAGMTAVMIQLDQLEPTAPERDR
jgi:quercetin dioxygenase-like cupin family protein